MTETLAKKRNVRKVLKNIVATSLQEAQGYLNENATNKTTEILSSYQDRLKREINAVETLETKSLSLKTTQLQWKQS